MYYLSPSGVEHYYLSTHEPDPDRNTRHKSHIPKCCMFSSAITRPWFDHHRNQWFNGKIGLWPIAHHVPAQKASANRPQDTLEWKNLIMDKGGCTQFLLEQVIPAIMEQWPQADWTVHLQQDDAHIPQFHFWRICRNIWRKPATTKTEFLTSSLNLTKIRIQFWPPF